MQALKIKIFSTQLASRLNVWLAAIILLFAALAAPIASASAAAGITNPVGGLINLGDASYTVGQKDGAGWGLAYGAGSLIGVTQGAGAWQGQNFVTGQALGTTDRWSMAFQGLSAASATAAGVAGISGLNPAVLGGAAEITTPALNILNPEFTPNALTLNKITAFNFYTDEGGARFHGGAGSHGRNRFFAICKRDVNPTGYHSSAICR